MNEGSFPGLNRALRRIVSERGDIWGRTDRRSGSVGSAGAEGESLHEGRIQSALKGVRPTHQADEGGCIMRDVETVLHWTVSKCTGLVARLLTSHTSASYVS